MSLRRTVFILWSLTILASALAYAQGKGLFSPPITASTGRPELEALARLNAEEADRLKLMLREAEINPPRRWEGFLETLLKSGSRKETESRLKSVNFPGFRVQVHERIAPALENVALACDALRKKDPGVAAFEDNGFVWGGKWPFFDTMHFEYRPEVLLLARARERP